MSAIRAIMRVMFNANEGLIQALWARVRMRHGFQTTKTARTKKIELTMKFTVNYRTFLAFAFASCSLSDMANANCSSSSSAYIHSITITTKNNIVQAGGTLAASAVFDLDAAGGAEAVEAAIARATSSSGVKFAFFSA